ncbi:MAG: hypothetical protein VX453_00045 [Acidobacteriota bacterium]|nr:hypothetical protein [Acidobacteriota bacterium]
MSLPFRAFPGNCSTELSRLGIRRFGAASVEDALVYGISALGI